MELISIFILPDGKPRAGWRLLLFVICWFLVSQSMAWLIPAGYGGEGRLWSSAAQLAGTMAVTWALLTLLDRRPFQDVGLPGGRAAWWSLAYGAAAGVGGVVLVAAALLAFAEVSILPAETIAAFRIGPLASTAAMLIIAGSFEELLFRGYPFQRLIEGVGAVGAVGFSSMLFGLIHLSNPSATALSTINTVLAGVLLSLAYLKSQSLWYPIAWHIGWNWALGLAGFPVSGLDLFELPWQAAGPLQNTWLHGGAYGPEGGAVVSVILIVWIGVLYHAPYKVGCVCREDLSASRE